ncbi:multidrug effflux MFS transporter [Dokdonella ginsengisoli]|uniref:Bcr/CflA family efflux transporter n=1 Tax=Dokdonella ginsengisoli TaxID=363846 RepID=A0ABV9R015_9GAMM
MRSDFFKTAAVLGLLTAIGPFAIDMYLPALPSIRAALHAGTGATQASLMVFFVMMGLAQLVYGPLSDIFGRKPLLYAGLVLFALGSIGCALATDIQTLIAFRVLQGLGASAGMVIGRAVVRDLHTGPDAAQMMSLLMLVFSVSPILAPLAGSLVIAWTDWRGIFWSVLVAALLGLVLLTLFLRETRHAHLRAGSTVRGALSAYRELLGDPSFLGMGFICAFGTSSFFAYLASSSFVLIEHYGLTPTQYSFFFSINAIAFIGAAQFNGLLARRFGLRRLARRAVAGYVGSMTALFALFALGIDSLAVLAVLLFVGYAFLGLVIPNVTVLALEEHGAIAGTASALIGTLQFLTGAIVMAIVSRFLDGTALPMVVGIAACALITFALARITLRGEPARAYAD